MVRSSSIEQQDWTEQNSHQQKSNTGWRMWQKLDGEKSWKKADIDEFHGSLRNYQNLHLGLLMGWADPVCCSDILTLLMANQVSHVLRP